MCNLSTVTKSQAAVPRLVSSEARLRGNLPLFHSIFPDQLAPIIRNGVDGERELVMARWGMPGPAQYGGVRQ
jgi:putative SOS response-associated peptidase YedK